jgi:hypothetical protein
VVASVGATVFIRQSCNEVGYRGCSLGYWFHELPLTFVFPGRANCITKDNFTQPGLLGGPYGSQWIEPRDSISAVREIGTNGLPFLIRKLSRHNSSITAHVAAFALKWGIRRPLLTNASMERAQAVTALVALSPLPDTAVEELRNMIRNKGINASLEVTFVVEAQTNTALMRAFRSGFQGGVD